ncbi:MAG TPA: VOC family protein [Caulobacteraceae bacterium]|jgi:catechol 2,3-dioxygenase-like lactoylglutathione lyase family enzyme
MVNHVDLTVLDPERSLSFYEAVLGFMGYRRAGAYPRGYEFDLVRPDGGFCSIGILKSQGRGRRRRHDRYSPGLHHLAWTAENREDVDRMHDLLLRIGATVLDAPAEYPQYGAGYYAVFFADPDGLKLEFVHWPRP